MLFLVVTLLSLCSVYGKHEAYEGHALFEVIVEDFKRYNLIAALEVPLQIDIWKYSAAEKKAVILIPKKNLQPFQNALHAEGIQFRMDVENIKTFLDEEDRLMDEARRKTRGRARVGFDRVYNLTEVYDYLDEVATLYPDLVTLVNAGKSFEGRDIKYLKISTTNFEDVGKPIIFVQSLLHAREWITLPATLYATDKLIKANVTDISILDKIDWIILPIANPDGYEFSHVEDRFWRKNRATGYMINDFCLGVDLNRNFDIAWGQYNFIDRFVCSQSFHGGFPFSEPESVIIRDIFEEYTGRIASFMDIHSVGSLILYGWARGGLVDNALSVHMAGIEIANAINAVKAYWAPNYIVGNLALVFSNVSGVAMDYATVTGVPYSYIYELPAHRNSEGNNVFLVDPAFVQQAAMETWEGIQAGARFIIRLRNGENN